jgi:DNA-3-methyladenine glycosylase
VTLPTGVAAAVLVRGLEPVEGLPPLTRMNGPGKLCRAMGITLAHNRVDLLGDRLFLEDAPNVPRRQIVRGPRIGVAYAGQWAEKPYRFWIRGNPHVSRGGR